ncbi:MAG: hypothetical protein ACLP0J_07245 [Solirubrobacteraceae bacterium]
MSRSDLTDELANLDRRAEPAAAQLALQEAGDHLVFAALAKRTHGLQDDRCGGEQTAQPQDLNEGSEACVDPFDR